MGIRDSGETCVPERLLGRHKAVLRKQGHVALEMAGNERIGIKPPDLGRYADGKRVSGKAGNGVNAADAGNKIVPVGVCPYTNGSDGSHSCDDQ